MDKMLKGVALVSKRTKGVVKMKEKLGRGVGPFPVAARTKRY